MPQRPSFVDRGGLWVLAQVPVMLGAVVIPIKYGAGDFVPRDFLAILGMALSVLAVWIVIWGLLSLGNALTPFPRPMEDATLHRQGAYRWMRHPIYAGLLLASLGWALWWLSLAGALYFLLVAVFFDRKAAHEENWLREKYKEYADYERQVKKFIPGLY